MVRSKVLFCLFCAGSIIGACFGPMLVGWPRLALFFGVTVVGILWGFEELRESRRLEQSFRRHQEELDRILGKAKQPTPLKSVKGPTP